MVTEKALILFMNFCRMAKNPAFTKVVYFLEFSDTTGTQIMCVMSFPPQ